MELGKYNSPRRPTISRKREPDARAAVIRDTARMLGIGTIEIEAATFLKEAFRIQFDDCTGRRQTLFLPFAASAARISQTLRLVSGPRARAG